MDPSDKLSGGVSKRLQEALVAAFPTRGGLARMVRLGLDENLEAIPFHVAFPSNPAFVGREEDLGRLHELLKKGGAVGVRPAALTGMGGIGKTQLAVEYAYRYAHTYPGGVYWVNAAGDDWRPALAKLAVELDLEARDAHPAERQIRLLAALAAYLRARPDALVIFDNVDRPADLRSDGRAGLVPMDLGVHLLFTTRRRGDDDGRIGCVEVSVLPEDAALELLLSSPGRRPLWEKRKAPEIAAEVAAARAICRALGALPLAVALAAAFLGKNPRVTLAGYSSRIARNGLLPAIDTNKVTSHDLATSHVAAVELTFALQWEALESEDARLTLRAAALLDEAQQIPRARLSLLTGLAAVAEEGFAAPMDGALQELSGLSLVEDVEEKKAIRLHPLVRAFARGRIEAREAFAATCASRLGEALWDMRRLHDEVAARGIDAVLADLRIGSKLAGAPGQARFEALIRPLNRESHALRGWDPESEPGFVLQQLRNRCFELGLEEARERAEDNLAEQRWAWLRERFRTSRESQALVRVLDGHTDRVRGVAVTSDGRFAVSASRDTTLKVWDLDTGQMVRTLTGHTDAVNGVAVTSDGRFAVSASDDRTLRVWDVAGGRSLITLETSAPVKCCAISPDGKTLLAGDDAGALHILDWMDPERPGSH